MLQRQRPLSIRRQGFTLVELLVVILIISILSALLTVAVTKGISAAKRTRNRVEIAQLAAAVDAFKTHYKVDYIPGRLLLSETGSYGSFPLAQESLAYLQRLWPRLAFNALDPVSNRKGINWNGSLNANGTIAIENTSNLTTTTPSGDMILEGDQCMVFLLGGIPGVDPVTGAPTCTGFSPDPSNPAAHLSGGAAARAPFYEFESGRLVSLHKGSARMFSYLDTYGTSDGKAGLVTGMPYLFFSAYQTRNGYNKASLGGTSDCSTFGVFPYAQGINQYLNPSSFQIISAGADLKFGPGTASPATTAGPFWTAATAAGSGASGADGADDQSNFYDSTLGTQSVN